MKMLLLMNYKPRCLCQRGFFIPRGLMVNKGIATELKIKTWLTLRVLDQGVGHTNLKGVFFEVSLE